MDTGDMGDAHWTFTIPLGAEDVRMLVEETIGASCMLSEVKQDIDSISDTSNVTLLAILSLRLENYMLHRSTHFILSAILYARVSAQLLLWQVR